MHSHFSGHVYLFDARAVCSDRQVQQLHRELAVVRTPTAVMCLCDAQHRIVHLLQMKTVLPGLGKAGLAISGAGLSTSTSFSVLQL